MTVVGQGLSSSSSSCSLSESCYSQENSHEQNAAIPFPIEDEKHKDTYSDEGQDVDEEQDENHDDTNSNDGQDLDEEQALVVPLFQPFEAEPVAILLPQDGLYGMIEFKDEFKESVQRLDHGPSQTEGEKLIMQASFTNGNYLPAPFLPANYLVSDVSANKLDKIDQYFKDCPPESTSKKRSRDETVHHGKQKEQQLDYQYDLTPSSDEQRSNCICEGIADMTSPLRSQVVGRFQACSFQDDNTASYLSQEHNKQRLVLSRSKWKRDAKAHDRVSSSTTGMVQWQRLINLPNKEDSRRCSYWPNWLHPAFHQEDDELVPRISDIDLQRLLQAIPSCQCTTLAYSALFQSVFGPIVFWHREEEMLETIRAVGVLLRQPNLINVQYEIDRCEPVLEGLALDNLFASRFLSSFPSFAAFKKRDEEYRQLLSEEQYDALAYQFESWYGGSEEVEEYQLWASARMLELDRNLYRPMSPKDLSPTERQAWQDKLDSCATYEEAVTVTEEVFGPLQQVDHYRKPRVNIKAVWNPCDCSICLRSHKRAKVQN